MLLHHDNHDHLAASELLDDGEGNVRVQINRALDQPGAALVAGDLRLAAVRATSSVVVDCTHCDFVDSSGLRVLVETQQLAEARHVTFGVIPSPNLQRVLEVTALTGLIDLT